MSVYDDNNCLDIVYNAKNIFIEASILNVVFLVYQNNVITKYKGVLLSNQGYLKKYMRQMMVIQVAKWLLYLVQAILIEKYQEDDSIPYILSLTVSQSLNKIQCVVLFVFFNKLKYAEIQLQMILQQLPVDEIY